jgi:two-component system, chemotaxis family, response regulator Rcp1
MRHSLFGRSIVGRAMEILLIENDLAEARAAMQILDHGHVRCRVSLVRDGDEALRFLRREGVFAKAPRPDLIMLEISLPRRNGCEVLDELHADDELKHIPVVVMQTADTCPQLLDGECYDVLEFMPKPLDAERFVSMVKSLHYSLLTDLVAGSMV